MFDLEVDLEQINRYLDDPTNVAFVCAIGLLLIALRFRSLRKKRKGQGRPSRRDPWHPQTSLIPWSDADAFTLQDSYCGCLVTGQTGGGKTSGPLATIAEAAFRAGFGGVINLVKDDRSFWEDIARRTGRSRDLVIFSPSQKWRWNFINHELSRGGRGAGLTENIVNLLMTALQTVQRNSAQGNGSERDPYWGLAARQLCRNLCDLCALSMGKIDIKVFDQIINSAPRTTKDTKSDYWITTSFCAKCIGDAVSRCPADRKADLDRVVTFFLDHWPRLSGKMRETISSVFGVMIDSLLRGTLRDLFCGETNVTPEDTEKGTIILIDMPVLEFGTIGALANGLWKYGFQRAIEKRDVRKSPRPTFLFVDEAQFLVTDNDHKFLSTCRASRVATVFATQNISNFYAAHRGRQSAQAEVDSLCGNLCTKVFCCNGDYVSNNWAANMIGQSLRYLHNASTSHQPMDAISAVFGLGPGPSTSAGMSEHLAFEIEPSVFPTLRSGGYENDGCVDSVVFASGKMFRDTSKPWRFHTFHQNLERRRPYR